MENNFAGKYSVECNQNRCISEKYNQTPEEAQDIRHIWVVREHMKVHPRGVKCFPILYSHRC
jgi:hypothetical protein